MYIMKNNFQDKGSCATGSLTHAVYHMTDVSHDMIIRYCSVIVHDSMITASCYVCILGTVCC